MSDLTYGSLCTGYGGGDMAIEQLYGARPLWVSDVDKSANIIIAQRYPNVPNLGDLTVIDWATVPPVDILTAGYPCQPFSQAGKRKGTDDARHLWPHIARAVDVLRPRICFFENVQGHLSKGGVEVVESLVSMGYSVKWGLVRASDAGAPHRRARVFIVATAGDADSAVIGDGPQRRAGVRPDIGEGAESGGVGATAADASSDGRVEGRAEPGQRSRSAGQPAGTGTDAAADTDGAGGQARQHTGHDGERVRVELEPVGPAHPAPDTDDPGRTQQRRPVTTRQEQPATERTGATAADTGSQRHGAGQDAGAVGRVDGEDAGQPQQRQRPRQEPGHRSAATPAHTDESGPQGRGVIRSGRSSERPTRTHSVGFGPYEAAIRRWEHILGRPAPQPTVPTGRNGGHRLNPRLVEWMMGLPEGWVTDTGISHVAQLKALGNGIVPQQALLALQHLTIGDH